MSRRPHTFARIGAVTVVLLIVLPLAGLWLAWLRPPGLVEPPPLSLDRIWPLMGRSLGLAAWVSALSLCFGTWLAFVEVRCRVPGVRWVSLLCLMPLAVPSYLLAAVLRETLGPGGWIGGPLGVTEPFTGFWPAVLTLTLCCVPYVHILTAAALRRINPGPEEAARALGASPWRRFQVALAPALRPTWAFSLAIIALYVVSDFGAVAVLDCEVLTWELYKAKGGQDAVLMGLGILVVVLPILVAVRLFHGRSHSSAGAGQGRPFTRSRLRGGWLVSSLLLQLTLVGLGLLLPLCVLSEWLIGGLTHGVSLASLSAPALDTLVWTLLGATAVLLLAMLPAWVVAQTRDRGGRWLQHGVWLVSALPGVLVAYGLLQVILGLRRVAPVAIAGGELWASLEGLGFFLLLGWAMRFLAEGYAALEPAFARMDPRLDESARSLGAGRWRRFSKVTLPSVTPSVAAAWLLLFLAVLKELPVTLMLIPVGQSTLAYRIFDAYQESALPDAAAAGLVLLAVAFVAQLALLRWRRHV